MLPETLSHWGPSKTFAPRAPAGSSSDTPSLRAFVSASISGSGDRAIVATGSGQILSIGVKAGYLQSYHRSEVFGVRAVAFTHHDASILCAAGRTLSKERSGTIVQLRLHDNVAVRMYGGHKDNHVVSISFHPGDDIFMSADDGGNVMLWSIWQSNPVAATKIGSKPVVTTFDSTGAIFGVAGAHLGVAMYSVKGFHAGPFITKAEPAELLRKGVTARTIAPLSARPAVPTVASASAVAEAEAKTDGVTTGPHDEVWTHMICSADGNFLCLTTSLGAVHVLDAFDLSVVVCIPEHLDGTGAAPTVLGQPDGAAPAMSAFSPCGSSILRPTACGRPECISISALSGWTRGAARLPTSSFPRRLVGSEIAGHVDALHPDPVFAILCHPTQALLLSVSASAAAFWTPPVHKHTDTSASASSSSASSSSAGAR